MLNYINKEYNYFTSGMKLFMEYTYNPRKNVLFTPFQNIPANVRK